MSSQCRSLPIASLPPASLALDLERTLIHPLYLLGHCGKCPKTKPGRWPRKLASRGLKPRQSLMPTSPPYSTYVLRRSKRRCTRSLPMTQVVQTQMDPQTGRRRRIRATSALLCERKSSVTTLSCTMPRASTRSPPVPLATDNPIPSAPLCPPRLVRSIYTASIPHCWPPRLQLEYLLNLKPCTLSYSRIHPYSWFSIPQVPRYPYSRLYRKRPSTAGSVLAVPGDCLFSQVETMVILSSLLPLVYMLYINGPIPHRVL